MAWSFVVTDLNGNVHGEVSNARSRKVTLPHLRIPSASFSIPIWSTLSPTVMDTDCLLKCYRTDPLTGVRTLAFIGPILTAEETGDQGAQSIAVTAAGPYWRLTKRIIPASIQPEGFGAASAASPTDLGLIARTIVQDVNGVSFSGIDLGTHANSTTGWIGKWLLKNAAEGIAELSAGLSSFEFRVRPTEPTIYANPEGWPRIGLFDVAPVIGVSRPDAVFEYGTTRANVASYTRTRSRDGILNRALISVGGWPDSVESAGTPPVPLYNLIGRRDDASVAARGLFEEVVSDAGILDDALRTKVADYHVLLRKQPREIITFKPAVNARPAPFADYEVGDTIRARAVVSGSIRFDALFRIWGITFDVDENGNENVELELVMP